MQLNFNLDKETHKDYHEIVEAYENGSLKEAFGTGTAVTVNAIHSITFEEEKMILISQEDSFALKLKQQLQAIQKGSAVDTYDWTSKVLSMVNN